MGLGKGYVGFLGFLRFPGFFFLFFFLVVSREDVFRRKKEGGRNIAQDAMECIVGNLNSLTHAILARRAITGPSSSSKPTAP